MEINPKLTTLREMSDQHFKNQKEEKEKALQLQFLKLKKIKKWTADWSFAVLIIGVVILLYFSQAFKGDFKNQLIVQEKELNNTREMVAGFKDYGKEIQELQTRTKQLQADLQEIELDIKIQKITQPQAIDLVQEEICAEEKRYGSLCQYTIDGNVMARECENNRYCMMTFVNDEAVPLCKERRCLK